MNICASMLQIGLSGKAFENRYCEKQGSERNVARREVSPKGAPVTAFTDLPESQEAYWLSRLGQDGQAFVLLYQHIIGCEFLKEGKEQSTTPYKFITIHCVQKKKKKIFEFSQLLQEKYQKISKHGLDDAEDVTSSSWEKKQQGNTSLLAFPYIT